MKNLTFFCLLFFSLFGSFLPATQAQDDREDDREEKREARREARLQRMESLRVAYITEKLSLTPDESKQFWPIYNEFKDKESELDDTRTLGRRKMETMSDKELETFMEQHFKNEEARVRLKREYSDKLRKVISIRKVAILHRLERDFRKELLERLQQD
jgi:hypothetical protein